MYIERILDTFVFKMWGEPINLNGSKLSSLISDAKMSATTGSDKLPMCILIPRETTKKTMQRHILKNNADHS